MHKIAIIGASYLQRPLVQKAKDMQLETHVFAWKAGNVVNDICDYTYDISILEKDLILKKCSEIQVDGIVSIASDIAMPTVNYVAHQLGLVGNSLCSTLISTDKFEMRKALSKDNIPCPKFVLYTESQNLNINELNYPVIVKPTDRSGSRGVTKVTNIKQIEKAIKNALENSINNRVIVEEFREGREFSVEAISFQGIHKILAITDKITSGSPNFVEIAHHQPAQIPEKIKEDIINLTEKVLKTLCIENGASHTEIILTKRDELFVVESAGRMGGDFIGSTLTPLSTGIDTLKAVIDISLSKKPDLTFNDNAFSGIVFLSASTEWLLPYLQHPSPLIIQKELFQTQLNKLKSSADRSGYIIYKSNKPEFNFIKQ